MKFKNKENGGPELSPNAADQMLQNIFDSCDVKPNSVPLEALMSYSNYRKDRFTLQKVLLIITLVVFCLLPALFIAPKYTINEVNDGSYNSSFDIKVDTFIPIKAVTATIEGQYIPVYESDYNTFTAKPTANGDMTVTVLLANRQYISKNVYIDNVDATPPTVVADSINEGKFYVTVTDDASGVDYGSIYALTPNNEKITPVWTDPKSNLVVFDCPGTTLNMYFKDKAENELHLVLTIR